MLLSAPQIRSSIDPAHLCTTAPTQPQAPASAPRPFGVSTFEAAKPARMVPFGPPPPSKVDPSRMPHINQAHPDGAWRGFPGAQVCGPTAALMLGKYFNSPALNALKTDADKIDFLWETFGKPGDNGTTPEEMGKMLDTLGLRFTRDGSGHVSQPGLVPDGTGGYKVNSDWMTQQINAGRPVLVQGNSGASGHWLIVTDVSGKPPVYTVNDPFDDKKTTMSDKEMRDFLANAGGGHLYAIEPEPLWIP